ncbi:MAG: GNAT family N-acetyltransferase [Candidatus Hodarchaeota archaeon]
MELYFRELIKEDIPAIIDISKDIWEGEDYIPLVIERWIKEKDCMNYGTFIDKEKKELIGFGRIKLFPNGVAWLEGGRVKITHQKMGVGREQLRYAIEYARKSGSKVAQYDTSSKNYGSVALAKYFGFKMRKRMEVLECKAEDLKISETHIPKVREIRVDEAKHFYREFNIGSGDEVCIGWSYIPLEFLEEKGSKWLINSDAILQKMDIQSQDSSEIPDENEVWLISYGNPNSIRELIIYVILSEFNSRKINKFEIFCNPDVVDIIKEFGFSYWQNEPFGVVLFEKKL